MAVCGASLGMNGNEANYGGQPQAVNGGYSMGYGHAATQGPIQAGNAGYSGYENTPVRPSTCGDDDCVQVIRTVKRVVVPCKRQVIKNVTVQVPKTVVDKIPKQMPYTDLEKRVRSIPYVTQREEVRYATTNQSYSTLVPKLQTKMVPITRRVPKTVWVNETTTVPQQETVMVPQIRHRNVRIPYKVNIPQTKYRNETYHVPVTKYKTVYQNVPKTIYEPRTKQQCTTVTKMVSKDIPVYSAIPRAHGSCPPEPMVGSLGRDFGTSYNRALNLGQNDYERGAGLSVSQPEPMRPTRESYPRDLDGPETPTPVN